MHVSESPATVCLAPPSLIARTIEVAPHCFSWRPFWLPLTSLNFPQSQSSFYMKISSHYPPSAFPENPNSLPQVTRHCLPFSPTPPHLSRLKAHDLLFSLKTFALSQILGLSSLTSFTSIGSSPPPESHSPTPRALSSHHLYLVPICLSVCLKWTFQEGSNLVLTAVSQHPGEAQHIVVDCGLKEQALVSPSCNAGSLSP